MRKLVWFTMGFALCAAVGAYLVSGEALFPVALLSIVLSLVCIFFRKRAGFLLQAAVLFVGCTVGAVWQLGITHFYLNTALECDGQTALTQIIAEDYSMDSPYGTVTGGKIELDGKSFPVRVYADDTVQLSPGDTVSGSFRLHCTVEGDRSSDAYLYSNGTYLIAYPEADIKITPAVSRSIRFLGAYLRVQIKQILENVFPEDTQAFARALLLGDTGGLDYETDTHFKLSGIRHIIAVSGLHVSILFSLVYQLSRKHRVLTALLGIPVLVVFAAVAGFTPSVVRACFMQGLMILAMLLNKEYDPPTALAFAVLTILAVNPAAVTSVSLQLSVGCVAGIFLFSGKIRSYLLQRKWLGGGKGKSLLARLGRWFASSVSITLSAMVFTAPLSALYFGTFTVLSVITNLATLWVVSTVFYGIMLSCGLSLLWMEAAKAVAHMVSWLMRYVCLVAKLIASIPISALYMCSVYSVLWLIFGYVLLSIFFFSKKRSPAVLAACLCVSLLISVGASWLEPRLDDYRVTVMDVGQGQSILLQCDNKNYLVDCGGSSDTYAADTAAAQLLSQGVSTLDGIVVTHYDTDHAGGVRYLLTRINARKLFLPVPDASTELDDALLSQSADNAVLVHNTLCIADGDVKLTVYAPEEQTTRNESSLCVLFQGKNCDILITGDRSISGERALLATTQLPKLDVLVVGHHGAADSAGLELLQMTRPDTAVISVGADNPYGHPNGEVLRRLKLFGCNIYRTDTDGTVTIRG